MNTAARVREEKERHPERFCADPRCLWRVETHELVAWKPLRWRPVRKPCPKHPLTNARESDTVSNGGES